MRRVRTGSDGCFGSGRALAAIRGGRLTAGGSVGAGLAALLLFVAAAPALAATVTYTGGSGQAGAQALEPAIAVTSITGSLESATVTIDPSGLNAGDQLFINLPPSAVPDLAVTYANGVLTLTATSGSASVAEFQTALQAVEYYYGQNDGDPTAYGNDPSRTIDTVITDTNGDSSAVNSTVVDMSHVPPTIVAGAAVAYTNGGAAVPLDSGLTASDPDSGGELVGATAQITSGFVNGDLLSFINQNGITGSYDASTGEMTLTGPASLAAYQAAMQSIAYSFSGGGDPTSGRTDTSRTIAWTVNDGAVGSTQVTSTVAVEDPPSKLAITSASLIGQKASTARLGPMTVTLEDPLGNPVSAAAGGVTVTVSSSSAGGVFADTADGSPVTTVTIPAGDQTASFYYGDSQLGAPTITVSASGLGSGTQTETIDQAPAITSANQSVFDTTGAGVFTVTTSGSPTPSLTETGPLPHGVTFTDNGNGTATLSGTPAAGSAGIYDITITAANGVSSNASQSFTLTVQTPAGPPPASTPPPTTKPTTPAAVTATKVTVSRSTVTWCRGARCRYPNTRLRFTLSGASMVRLVLSAKVNGRWRQVAATEVHARHGSNSYRIAGRWRGQLVAIRHVRLRFQLKRNGHWQTQKLMLLTVHHQQR
jgi:hypothetical protein